MFSEKDKKQIRDRGISNETIEWQMSVFRDGIKTLKLDRAASVNDGIIRLTENEVEEYTQLFDGMEKVRKMKFVPASGAASRMFKSLFEFMDAGKGKDILGNEFMENFFINIRNFAFYDDLEKAISNSEDSLDRLLKNKEYNIILQYLLTERGLNYGNLPKGLLKFHKYNEESKTPFEEHVGEAINYAKSGDGKVLLHFTVSPEHLEAFDKLLQSKKDNYANAYGVDLEVSFSIQKPSTDTIAVDITNQPFREEDGGILFRPGGHGALIDNLNELDADLIFVKNIDNVVPEKLNGPTVKYKKALAALLLKTQKKVFEILEELETTTPSPDRLKEVFDYYTGMLRYFPKSIPDFNNVSVTIKNFIEILNRPLRICGVVKNLGEPGGGPFWAPNSRGDLTLQIVESSQVDIEDPEQENIFKGSTHFNPVDLVCSTKDYKGKKFHLPDYVDRKTCFVSEKSKDGRELKALELPGLWNGAMADWLTLMVEVPVETFNPVKTVNDLLRPQHQ